GLVGNGSFGGSLPKNSYWEKQFEDQVQKTAVMEEKLMAATIRLDEMEKLIRSLHIPPGFQQRVVLKRRLLKKTRMSHLVKMRVESMRRLEKL
ncbi:hypothetical protein Tsubulata_030179, partial [Turnera subulata]